MNNQSNSSDYISNFFHQLANVVPKFLGFLLILLIGYIISKVIASLVRKALAAVRLNQRLHTGQGGNLLQRAIPNPTEVISRVVFWLLILFTLSVAVSILGIPALEQIVHGIFAYLPNVLAAFLIFLVAGAISGVVATLITNAMGDTPTGKIAATAAPIVVMGLAFFMILNQLKIAPAIVIITYAGIIGTATLAFGLGGKEAASKMFMNLYESGQKYKGTAREDVRKGAATAKDKANNVRRKAK